MGLLRLPGPRTCTHSHGGRPAGLGEGDDCPLGAVVGLVSVADCVPLFRVRRHPDAEGPWCWLLADALELERPVPCKGRLGLWSPPRGVLRAVLAQFG
jgi:hypothetical protein